MESMKTISDYTKYRGKCQQMSKDLCEKDPNLTLCRGHYVCPLHGSQEHWWCKDKDGNIVDPTVKQFATSGVCAEYIEFDGYCVCEVCGKKGLEEDFQFAGRYPVCSTKCYIELVL